MLNLLDKTDKKLSTLIIVLAILIIPLGGLTIMLTWNGIITKLISCNEMTFGQGFMLYVVYLLLFKGGK